MAVEQVWLAPYNPSWPSLFGEERVRVGETVGRWAKGIEHIGSTAVRGLDAKPVIDMMVGLKAMSDADYCVEALIDLGYSYWVEGAEPHHRLFVRFVNPAMTARTHNLHLVEAGGRYWKDRLLFRDYLREHPETGAKYARLKYELARRYRDDREAYTRAKADFVSGIVRLASGAC